MNEEKTYKIENIEELQSEKNKLKKEAALFALMAGSAAIMLMSMHKINKTDISLCGNILSYAVIGSVGGLGVFKFFDSIFELSNLEDQEETLNNKTLQFNGGKNHD